MFCYLITITGRGFDTQVNGGGVTKGSVTTPSRVLPFCRFGGIEVPAVIINTSAIQCTTPSALEVASPFGLKA